MNQFIEWEQFNTLINDMSKLNKAINKIQDRIDFMNPKLDKLVTMFQRNNQTIASDVNSISEATPPPLSRTSNTCDITLNDLITNLFPWLNQIILTNVISRKLEIKDLVKLISKENRSKGRFETAELASDFHFDDITGRIILVIENSISYNKNIPDSHTLTQILVIYDMLRDLLNIDNTCINIVIHHHQCTLVQ